MNMTKGKLVYYYIASSLAILVPVPGRLAYGIILLMLFNLQMFVSSMVFHAVEHLHLSILKNSIISFALIAVTIFFKQILILICPIAALTLGFCLYLPALTSAVIELFFTNYDMKFKPHLVETMKKSLYITVPSLLYFFLRDLIGFGTITLPAWKKLFILRLPFNAESTAASMFMATIPGSLIFLSVILCVYIILTKKLRILQNSPENISESSVCSENKEGRIK